MPVRDSSSKPVSEVMHGVEGGGAKLRCTQAEQRHASSELRRMVLSYYNTRERGGKMQQHSNSYSSQQRQGQQAVGATPST